MVKEAVTMPTIDQDMFEDFEHLIKETYMLEIPEKRKYAILRNRFRDQYYELCAMMNPNITESEILEEILYEIVEDSIAGIITRLSDKLEEYPMTRTEEYLTALPKLKELYDMIQTVKNANHVTVTVTTGTPHCKVINKLENPHIDITYYSVNNIDEATLLIRGRKTYSFSMSHTKIIDIVSATGTTHRIKFSHMGDDYEVEFSVKN